MQTSLREKVWAALDYEPVILEQRSKARCPGYCALTSGECCAAANGGTNLVEDFDVEAVENPEPAPDPEDIAVVERCARLAIEKDRRLFGAALATVLGLKGFHRMRAYDAFLRGAEATHEQRRTAALSVLHGVPVSTVRGWV